MNLLWFRSRRHDPPWPTRFHDLATYNAEHARGIVHTPAWVERMRAVQAEFDQWRESDIIE